MILVAKQLLIYNEPYVSLQKIIIYEKYCNVSLKVRYFVMSNESGHKMPYDL